MVRKEGEGGKAAGCCTRSFIMEVLRKNYHTRKKSKINGGNFLFYSVINELEVTTFHFLLLPLNVRALVLIFMALYSFFPTICV